MLVICSKRWNNFDYNMQYAELHVEPETFDFNGTALSDKKIFKTVTIGGICFSPTLLSLPWCSGYRVEMWIG